MWQRERRTTQSEWKLHTNVVVLCFSLFLSTRPFLDFSFILPLSTAVKRKFSRCLLNSERLPYPKTTTLLFNTNNNTLGIGELSVSITVGYCYKGQWHEPEMKRFLQSRRYIFLQEIMKLHEFQNLFNLNQLVEKFFRWKRLRYIWYMSNSIVNRFTGMDQVLVVATELRG